MTEEPNFYADHEIKDEMVIGPMVLQSSVVVESNCLQDKSDKLNNCPKLYRCDICQKCFITEQRISNHRMRLTLEKNFLSVKFVPEVLKQKAIVLVIEELTLEKICTSVMFAIRVLLQSIIWKLI